MQYYKIVSEVNKGGRGIILRKVSGKLYSESAKMDKNSEAGYNFGTVSVSVDDIYILITRTILLAWPEDGRTNRSSASLIFQHGTMFCLGDRI